MIADKLIASGINLIVDKLIASGINLIADKLIAGINFIADKLIAHIILIAGINLVAVKKEEEGGRSKNRSELKVKLFIFKY